MQGQPRHHVAMFTPETHIRRLAIEYIAERSMTVVARTAQHGEVSVNLTREHHAITVERQISVLQLMEGLEIERVSHADRRAMITVTPSHIITILDKTYTGVVGVNKLADLLVVALKLEFCLGDTPSVSGLLRYGFLYPHFSHPLPKQPKALSGWG